MILPEKEDMMYTWDFVKTMEKMGYQKGYRAGKKYQEIKQHEEFLWVKRNRGK